MEKWTEKEVAWWLRNMYPDNRTLWDALSGLNGSELIGAYEKDRDVWAGITRMNQWQLESFNTKFVDWRQATLPEDYAAPSTPVSTDSRTTVHPMWNKQCDTARDLTRTFESPCSPNPSRLPCPIEDGTIAYRHSDGQRTATLMSSMLR